MHPKVKENFPDVKISDIPDVLDENDLLKSSNITGRHAAPFTPRDTGMLGHSEKMAFMNKPEGLARVMGLNENGDILIRVDDFHRLDFWMEITIPVDQITSLLGSSQNK